MTPAEKTEFASTARGRFFGGRGHLLARPLPGGAEPFGFTLVSSVSALIPTIQVVNPEVIFLDLALARPEPLEVVRRVHRATPDVPLIVFAEAAEKDYSAQSLKDGALG
ncbi:MAG TPA: hypothetical protein VIW93_00750 [Candidatus Acidoferrum sp.]